MSGGDTARKKNLIDYGFRLPSSYDNRPLRFEEFEEKIGQAIFVSATPGPYEKANSSATAEQLIRPTGLLDPMIDVRPVKGQIDDLYGEIRKRAEKGERVLITTLTKKMAEDLTEYYEKLGVKVKYIHHNIDTVERMEIIRDLRLGVFDVLIGINLLREGLDIPEVSLVAILDADKEGFLRSESSLIQTVGRAARNANGTVIMYADQVTDSMHKAIKETERRRTVQNEYNVANGIVPKTIKKDIRDVIDVGLSDTKEKNKKSKAKKLTKSEKEKKIAELTTEMRAAAQKLEFEKAAHLRDVIKKLREE